MRIVNASQSFVYPGGMSFVILFTLGKSCRLCLSNADFQVTLVMNVEGYNLPIYLSIPMHCTLVSVKHTLPV